MAVLAGLSNPDQDIPMKQAALLAALGCALSLSAFAQNGSTESRGERSQRPTEQASEGARQSTARAPSSEKQTKHPDADNDAATPQGTAGSAAAGRSVDRPPYTGSLGTTESSGRGNNASAGGTGE